MIQPDRDYPTPDISIMYRDMVKRNRLDQEQIHGTLQKRRARMKAEEEIRERWDNFTQEEQEERINKLQEVCNELIKHHPDYKCFKTARVYLVDGTCRIHWNGAKSSDVSGWGMVDRKFPACEVNLIIKRYQDRMRNFTKDEEI